MTAPGAAERRHRSGSPLGLTAAAGILLVSAASLLGLVFAGGLVVRADTAGALALAIWLGLVGIETYRGRHFAIAILTPLALGVADVGYAIVIGRAEAAGGAVFMILAVLLVAGSRDAFDS